MTKPIPTLESVSTEYARLTARHDELNTRLREVQAEQRALHTELGASHSFDAYKDRISSLIANVDFEPPAPIKEKLRELHEEQRVINDALHEIGVQITEERRKASAVIVDQFAGENGVLAAKFFKLVAEAAEVHIEHGKLAQAFRKAGIETARFFDFGQELFGPPGMRNNDVNYLLKTGVKRGFIGLADLPEEYR